jgi:cell division protein FtsL
MIRPAMVLIILLAAALSLTLFVVKYQVQDLEEELVGLNRAITEDRQAIHVLKAEWSHLNEPSRLRKLAERYLGLSPVATDQVGTANELLPKDGGAPEPVKSPISQTAHDRVTPLATPISVERPSP